MPPDHLLCDCLLQSRIQYDLFPHPHLLTQMHSRSMHAAAAMQLMSSRVVESNCISLAMVQLHFDTGTQQGT